MSEEAIQKGRFGEASDVWAFGVLGWEVLTLGNIPRLGLGARNSETWERNKQHKGLETRNPGLPFIVVNNAPRAQGEDFINHMEISRGLAIFIQYNFL